MAFLQGAKWLFCIAGGTTAAGILNYFHKERAHVTAWAVNIEPTVKWDSNWDKYETSAALRHDWPSGAFNQNTTKNEGSKLPTATRHLILVRHGQYNTSGNTDDECNLTDLGVKQAQLTGQRLENLKYPYTRIIHSTMTRAKQTAEIIYKFLLVVPMESDQFLEEGAPILPEPTVDYWQPDPKDFFVDNARIEAAFRKYFHRAGVDQKQDSYEILVCHGNVIRYCLCRVLQVPPEAWLRFSLHHCSLSIVSILPSGRVIVRAVGECGHIPRTKMTIT